MKPKIIIGHLPLLDHLILGVAKKNESAYLDSLDLQTQKFPNWQTITNAFIEKKIDGAFLFFPLALELFRNGEDIKIILLGHREGQVLVTRNEIQSVKDLQGKTIFIPHRYSTHHILLFEILKNEGIDITKDVQLQIGYEDVREVTELLAANKIQAFIIAEPLGTEAVRRKIGKIIVTSHQIKTHHIDCVLAMRNDVIDAYPEACAELTESLVKAGMFVNAYPRQAAEIGEEFLGYWSKSILLEALTHDKGHILFWDLLPRMEDFEDLQDIAVEEMNLWPNKINLTSLIYPQFAQDAYREWMIDVRKEIKDRGKERTLPGNFSEAATRFQSLLGMSISILGMKFVQAGEKYPKGMKKVELPSIETDNVLDYVSAHNDVILKNFPGQKENVVFFAPKTASGEPERILLRLTREQGERCLMALHFGKENVTKDLDIFRSEEKELFLSKDAIVAYETERHTWLSLEFNVFRFLSLLLEHF